MAIPKDTLDKNIIQEELLSANLPQELSTGADLPESEPIQVAAVNPVVRKATDAITEPLKRKADVIRKPLPSDEAVEATVSDPLVRVEQTGDILVRRATAEELANFTQFADEVPVDSEIVLGNQGDNVFIALDLPPG